MLILSQQRRDEVMSFRSRTGAGVPLLMAASLLSACSPYLYKKEIVGFQTGLSTLSTAYDEGHRRLTEEQHAARRWDWLSREATLVPSAGCYFPPSTGGCGLQEVGRAVVPSNADREIARAAGQIRGLERYAEGLAAVTNAEDRAALDAAAGSLKSAIADLAAAGGLPAPPVEILTQAFAAYLDQRRYTVLRTRVLEADGLVSATARALESDLNLLAAARAVELRASAALLAGTTGQTPSEPARARTLERMGVNYPARVAAAQADTATLESLRRADPGKAARDLSGAHAALAKALRDPSRQTGAVLDAVETFVDSARALRGTTAAPAA
jgi:hypothetical protein